MVTAPAAAAAVSGQLDSKMARFLMLLLILAAIMPGGAFLELPFMQGLSTFGSKVGERCNDCF